ncbi:MAG: magnesium transporter [Halobacteria archaeon]
MTKDTPDVIPESWRISRIMRTMLPLLAVLSLMELFSGTVLQGFQETYVKEPVLLVLVPVVISTAGDLGSMLSSRLSTALHLGTMKLEPHDTKMWGEVVGSMFLAFSGFVFLGVAAWGIGFFLNSTLSLTQILAVTVTSGVILGVVVVIVSLTATYLSYVFGYDPDDTVIPVVTNVCDVSGIVILTSVIILLLH